MKFLFENSSLPSSTMTTPNEWCTQGRTWDAIPQSMKQVAEQILQVPKDLASALLPSLHLSINAMLKFHLSNSIPSLPTSNTQLYFSHKQPDFLNDILVLSLKHLLIPPASIIQKLSTDAPQTWLDGYNSVKYTHLAEKTATYFPLWIVTLWNSILNICAKIQKPWHKAQDWLQQQMYNPCSVEQQHLAQMANKLLNALPWKGRKLGLSNCDENHDL